MIGTLIIRLGLANSILHDGDSLLLTQTEFNREIARERIRATRRSIPFCILTIDLIGRRRLRQRRESLIRLLHRKVRLTDQKADLKGRRFAVLLVDTPEMGGRAVLDRLNTLCESRKLNAQFSLRVHDPEGFNSEDDDSFSLGSGNRRQGDLVPGPGDQAWLRVDDPQQHRESSDLALADLALAVQENPEVSELPASCPAVPLQSTATRAPFIAEEAIKPLPLASRVTKRSIDLVGASVALVLTSPLLAAAALAIKLTGPGPVFFLQKREGRCGKPFMIIKLRTMVMDAESKQAELRGESHRDGPAFKIKHDPRVTSVGHFLRRTCIDELPQLINVLRGEMSLVGPRPLPWEESRACDRWHRRRLDVMPGMTCHWQVNKAAAETFDDWMRMDLNYVDRNNLFQDLRLIAHTVVVPVTGRGSE